MTSNYVSNVVNNEWSDYMSASASKNVVAVEMPFYTTDYEPDRTSGVLGLGQNLYDYNYSYID